MHAAVQPEQRHRGRQWVAPYLLRLATDEQKRRWLPGFCSGEIITAIAMTEPGTGSDLQGIQTTARLDRGDWVLNGLHGGYGYMLEYPIAKRSSTRGCRRSSAARTRS